MAKKQPAKKDDTPYLIAAAKMTPYEVDITERLIYASHDELEECRDDMVVRHLCNDYNFHVQSCITTVKKELFDPQLSKNVLVRKEAKISPYKIGQLYKVNSTGSIMNIVRTEQKKIELGYVTYDERLGRKPNLIISEEQLETNLRKGVLSIYNQ